MSSSAWSLSLGDGASVSIPPSTGIPGFDSRMAAVTAGTKRGVWQPGQEGLFAGGDGAQMRDKRRRIEAPGTGQTMPATGGPFDGRRTGLSTQPYPRTPVSPPQRAANQNQPYTRIVKRGAPGMQLLDTVAINQWVLIHSPPNDPSSTISRESSTALQLQMEDGMQYEVNTVPVTAVAPQHWNTYMLKVQMRIKETNPEAFRSLEAADLMKDWSWDGVCISEDMLNGAESQLSGGFGRKGAWRGGDGYKVISSNLRGECHCLNVFGDSVIEGGCLYAIVRKEDVPAAGFTFEFDSRPHARAPLARGVPVTDREFIEARGTATSVSIAQALANAKDFKPFMMRLVCTPDEESLPIGYRTYTDELGVVHPSDITFLGRVLIAPHGNIPRMLPDDPNDGPQPLTGISGASEKGLMKVLVNPRGLHPLC